MARLSILDILHRGVVYSLAGVTLWAVVSSVAVHRHTIQAGKGIVNYILTSISVVYLAFVQYMERKEAEERQQQEEAARTSGNVSEAVKLGSS